MNNNNMNNNNNNNNSNNNDNNNNFIEITLRSGCSPVNLLHIYRTTFLRTPVVDCILRYAKINFRDSFLWSSRSDKSVILSRKIYLN